jgi:thiol-disulfide isomerase/thioredoxin
MRTKGTLTEGMLTEGMLTEGMLTEGTLTEGMQGQPFTFKVPLYDNSKTWNNQTLQFGNNAVPEETLLIYYYAPWCVNCIEFNEHWKQLKEFYKGSSRVLLVDIDCEKNPLVAQLANVGQFPTLRIIRGSRVVEYPHNRSMTFEGITQYLRTRSV